LKIHHIIQKQKKPIIKVAISATFLIVALGIIRLFSFYNKPADEDDIFKQKFNEHYKVFAINIPENVEFAGEKVPINDFDVRERLDRELLVNTYWQSQTLLLIKRSNRWMKVIEPILKKNNVPEDFKFLALVESGFTQNVSSKGAAGFWQFMPATAQAYNLIVNDEIDERYHLEKATEAACKYFKDAYQKFGSWTLVAASYNMGINGIAGQMERQKTNNYYDLLLNDETARYVLRVVAIKEIVTNPKQYGFYFRQKDLYPSIPTEMIKVDSTIKNIPLFVSSMGYTYKMFKFFNPWLRTDKLNNPEKKTYIFRFPKKDLLENQRFIEMIDRESSVE